MGSEVRLAINKLRAEGKSDSEIRSELISQGFMEDEIASIIKHDRGSEDKRNNRLLLAKEFFDRLGYGFATPQFINILFWQSGAGLFLLGIFNGLKAVFSLILSSLVQEFSLKHRISKRLIANAGLLFGFSFFIMAFGRLAHNPWIFGLGFLLSIFGVVAYGDLFNKLADKLLAYERRSRFLRNIGQYGILVTTISLLFSGWLIDRFSGDLWVLGGFKLKVYGFLISFMITTFAFIISSYIISKIKDYREKKEYPFGAFIKEHCSEVRKQAVVFIKNPYVGMLLLASSIAGLLQLLGASYYGVFIYKTFRHHSLIPWFSGGFSNVALIYSAALITGLLGPFFTRRVERSTGLAPHLVFGTMLTSILPLVLVYNPNFLAVTAALMCSVVGAVVVGVAQGLITRKIMGQSTRRSFFITQSFVVALLYLVLVPLGSWVAQAYGLSVIFRVVGFGLVFIVAPLYFLLVLMTNKARL